MPNLVGQTLGRYHIVEQLGEGGMAVVYKAFDTRLERAVALKVIRTERMDDYQFLERFKREALALAKLAHPNIVHINDYGDEDGVPYLVMDYIPAGTLKERIGAPIPWAEAAWFLAPVARALEFAHKQGIIHRDIKPSNILVTDSGQPMLTDFGIAKMLEDEKTGGLTTTGMGMGTPEYMSPEQLLGNKLDGRTDVYSLGTVFYEMVTGRTPYKADTPMAIALKQVNDPLPRPRQFVPALPAQTEQVIFKSLAKKPEDRYLDMGAFAAALENLAASVPAAKRGSTLTAPILPAQPAEAIPAKKLAFGRRIKKLYKENSTCVILVIIGVVLLTCLCVTLGAIRQNQDKKNAALIQTAQTVQPPINTQVPPLATLLPASTNPIGNGNVTPTPKISRIKTCNLISGQPTIDAEFPQEADKIKQDPSKPMFYIVNGEGKFSSSENGVRLDSGPASPALIALRSAKNGSALAVRSFTNGPFTIALVDSKMFNDSKAENAANLHLALVVQNTGDNNGVIYANENGVDKVIASFQYPLRQETITTIDTANHILTVQGAAGRTLFSTGLPEFISSSDSYWLIGNSGDGLTVTTNLLLRGICFRDTAP